MTKMAAMVINDKIFKYEYIHLKWGKLEKNVIKLGGGGGLARSMQMDMKFMFMKNICPQAVVCPVSWLYTCI